MRDATQKKPPLFELADQAAAGNPASISKLLGALAPAMIRAAQRVLGSSHPDLDDVVQQSLIGLVRALPDFRGGCTPTHYAIRITVRVAVCCRRRAHRRDDRTDPGGEFTELQSLAPELSDQVAAGRRRRLVRELLEELPTHQAEAFAMRVALGFTLAEVAAASGVPSNTVRSRIRLAKEALRRRVEADPELEARLELD